jgi:hypothetical protein
MLLGPEYIACHETFLQVYRPDINPNTTFDFISVDDGINNQLPAGAGPFVVSLRFVYMSLF